MKKLLIIGTLIALCSCKSISLETVKQYHSAQQSNLDLIKKAGLLKDSEFQILQDAQDQMADDIAEVEK